MGSPADIAITVASPGHVVALLPMMHEFNRLEGIEVDGALHREALETLLLSGDLGRVFLFDDGGTPVGYAVVTFNWDLEFGGRDAFLTELYLVPSARGTGLGTHALRAIERASAALDVKALHLLVRPENTVARRLYAAAGYVSPPRLLLGKVFDSG